MDSQVRCFLFWSTDSDDVDDDNDDGDDDDDDNYDDDDDDDDGADHLHDILPSWSWSAKLNISSISSSNTGTGRFLIISLKVTCCNNFCQIFGTKSQSRERERSPESQIL